MGADSIEIPMFPFAIPLQAKCQYFAWGVWHALKIKLPGMTNKCISQQGKASWMPTNQAACLKRGSNKLKEFPDVSLVIWKVFDSLGNLKMAANCHNWQSERNWQRRDKFLFSSEVVCIMIMMMITVVWFGLVSIIMMMTTVVVGEIDCVGSHWRERPCQNISNENTLQVSTSRLHQSAWTNTQSF